MSKSCWINQQVRGPVFGGSLQLLFNIFMTVAHIHAFELRNKVKQNVLTFFVIAQKPSSKNLV